MRTTYKLLGVLFVEIFLITSLSLSDGGAEEWSGKMRLGGALSFSGKPALAIDPRDNLLVVWINREMEICHLRLGNNEGGLMSNITVFQGSFPMLPDIAVDRDGYSHIVWTDGKAEPDKEIWYAKLRGDTVDLMKRVTDNPTRSDQPVAAVDSEGSVHIIWRDVVDGNLKLHYTKLDHEGGKVVQDVWLTEGSYFELSDIAIDAEDKLHVVYWEKIGGVYKVNYMKLDKNGEKIVNETRLDDSIKTGRYDYPAITVDSKGEPHIAWTVGRTEADKGIWYAKLDKSGNTTGMMREKTRSRLSAWPALAVDTDDNLHLVWADGRFRNLEIFYANLDNIGAKEGDDLRLTRSWGGCWLPTVATDSENVVHVAWMEFEKDGFGIYHKSTGSQLSYSIIDRFLNRLAFETIFEASSYAIFYTVIALALSLLLFALLPSNLLSLVLVVLLPYVVNKLDRSLAKGRNSFLMLLLTFMVIFSVKIIGILFRLPIFMGVIYQIYVLSFSTIFTAIFITSTKMDLSENTDRILSTILFIFWDTFALLILYVIRGLHIVF